MTTSNNNQIAATILAQTIVSSNAAARAAAQAQEAAALVEGMAPLNSPAFTGTPTAITPDAGDNSTRLATTAYFDRTLGVANGVATLDSSGLIPADQLPSLALTTVYTVNSQVAMLALPADPGDLAVRTDVNETFILTALPASTLGNWTELLFSAPVTSVAGLIGVISATALTAALNVAVGDSGSGGLRGLVGAAAAGDAAAGKVWGAGGAFVVKADLASPAFSGVPTVPTAAVDTNTGQIASVAFVLAQAAAATPLMDGVAAVGTSTRYARADHIHPTDTSLIPLTAIGVTVQAYDADTAKVDVAQTFTAPQRGTVTPQTSLTLNLSTTNNFAVTPSGDGALTFSNPSTAVGQSGNIWFDNSGGHAITADSLVYISSAALATISVAGVYWLSYFVKDSTHIGVSYTAALT